MHFIRDILLLGTLATASLLAGCSSDLSKADMEGITLTTEKFSFFGSIPLIGSTPAGSWLES